MNKYSATRRGFLGTTLRHAALAGLTLAPAARAFAPSAAPAISPIDDDDPWRKARAIADRLAHHVGFRKADYPITDFGAKPCTLTHVKARISFEEAATLPTPAPGAPDCRAAIAAAIAACQRAGGGRVLIPAGDWLCAGPIVLLSNVNVHLQSGAHVYFSNDPRDYATHGDVDCGANGKLVVSRWQSNDCLNFSPMVYARGQRNIALTGDDWSAILDGQGGVPFPGAADCWWSWKAGKAGAAGAGKPAQNTVNPLNAASLAAVAPGLDEARRLLIQGDGDAWRADDAYLPALSEAGVPLARRVFGLGHFLRPPMIQFIECTDVLLQGYQVVNTPFWQHHPVACRNLAIRDVHANSLGPNSDGFDPEACDTVLVDGCQFNTGDDCIAIKAGKNLDTGYGPAQRIVIQNCTMQSGHGALTLGSEMAGGIQDVYAQDLVFENKNWATNPLNTAIRLKTNLNRGGFLRHLYVRNVRIPNGVQTRPAFYASLPGSPIPDRSVATGAGAIVTIDCDYTPRADNLRIRAPDVSHIHIQNVKAGNVATVDGQRLSCHQAIVVLGPVAADYNGPAPRPPVPPVRDVTIRDCDFGTPGNAAQPWYLYNVRGLRLERVTIAGKVRDAVLQA